MSNTDKNVLKNLFRPFASGIASLVVFSFATSVLHLVPPVFLMQLSERVMLSRNETTLLFLAGIAIFLMAALTILDFLRTRTLSRVSVAFDAQIGERLFDALNRRDLRMTDSGRNQILSDLNNLRDFIAGPIVIQLFDLFWVPLILLVMFLLHPALGLTMLVILTGTVALAVGNQWAVGEDIKRAQSNMTNALEFARAVIRNADTNRAMGMIPALRRRWRSFHDDALAWQHAAMQRSELWTGASRFLRNSQMIVLLVVGTFLFLYQQVTAGAVFAVVYIAIRVVTPVFAVTASWRAIWNTMISVGRLNLVLSRQSAVVDQMTLPQPDGAIKVSRVVLTPPHADKVVLGDVSFSVQSGRILGVVGPSGAGKSSLAKLLIGAWHPRRGTVHFGGHDLTHWNEDELGVHIGYLPQDIELLPGTVAENIGRFREDPHSDYAAILEAAELAGIGDIIQGLPEGFNTKVGFDGYTFSAGQRQRIALARALYGSPSILVLDEPNSNLDAFGEQNLGRCLNLMKQRGATVVLITHRLNMLTFCDDLLVMNAGTVHTMGPRDTIMGRLSTYRLGPAPALETAVAQ